jgi:hypothetical protein
LATPQQRGRIYADWGKCASAISSKYFDPCRGRSKPEILGVQSDMARPWERPEFLTFLDDCTFRLSKNVTMQTKRVCSNDVGYFCDQRCDFVWFGFVEPTGIGLFWSKFFERRWDYGFGGLQNITWTVAPLVAGVYTTERRKSCDRRRSAEKPARHGEM